MIPFFSAEDECIVSRILSCSGDVVAFQLGDIILLHRLIVRFPKPFHRWGIQRGDAHHLGGLIDLNTAIGKVVWPEVSRPTHPAAQITEVLCHLAWYGASKAKRMLLPKKK